MTLMIDPLTGKRRHCVPRLQKELPEILIRVRFLREARCHADDGDGIACAVVVGVRHISICFCFCSWLFYWIPL